MKTDTTTTNTDGRSFERPLVQQLRDTSKTGPQGSIWANDARRLMLWAARTIDAADDALMENYKHNTEAKGPHSGPA
jgi:hypothetical protein